MHDQLGGGFHRYSVDDSWFVPHFEKMLYDQAQLAVSIWKPSRSAANRSMPRSPATSSNTFSATCAIRRRLLLRQDADSVIDPPTRTKRRGRFYIWTRGELDTLLARRAAAFARHFGCRDNGNVESDPHAEFTGRNILYQAEPSSDAAEFAECRRILLDAARGVRARTSTTKC